MVRQAKPVEQWVSFGTFRYAPERRVLFDGDRLVPLGGPETILLAALLEHAGELLTKEALVARMWPDRTVADCNLRWQVSSLRRRLRCSAARRYILAVSGRGYRFVCPVETATAPEAARQGGAAPVRTVGREALIAQVRHALSRHRLVTLTGPAGIGKSSVAQAVSALAESGYADSVVLVDMAQWPPDQPAPASFAQALGREVPARALLLIDNCNAATDGLGHAIERLLETSADLRILATACRPLACAGECVVAVGALALPPPAPTASLRANPAVALFLDRLGGDRTDDAPLAAIAAICRRLDGHPLAIALAADEAATLGANGVLSLLDDTFILGMRNRRGGSVRHHGLAAAFMPHYAGLAPSEQRLLRWLSRFRGPFGLAAVRALLPKALVGAIGAGLAQLVARALLVPHESGADYGFRLLEPVRAFAAERLAAEGEAEAAAERHATMMCDALAPHAALPVDLMANTEAALDWAFATPGRELLAIRLVIEAARHWVGRAETERAAARLRAASALAQTVELPYATRARLHSELVGALAVVLGRGSELVEVADALIGLARAHTGTPDHLRGLWAQWVDRVNSGNARAALALAEDFERLAREGSDRNLGATADRLAGISLHLTGDQHGARARLDRTLAVFAWPERNSLNLPYQFDQRVVVLAYRARVALLVGEADQALQMAAAAVAEAEEMRHPLSAMFALAIGHFPVALLLERHQLAERLATRLAALAGQSGVDIWQRIARALAGWLDAARGAAGLAALQTSLAEISEVPIGAVSALAVAALAEAAGRLARPQAGLMMLHAATDDPDASWCGAELLRVRAWLHACVGHARRAQADIDAARALAERQGASFWQARIDITRATLVGTGRDRIADSAIEIRPDA